MDKDENSQNAEQQLCDVCGLNNFEEILSSRMAPVSMGLCAECIKRGAEVLGVVNFWVFTYGGPKSAPDFASQLVSFDDGKYLDWPEIEKLYLENEPSIRADFEKEFTPGNNHPEDDTGEVLSNADDLDASDENV